MAYLGRQPIVGNYQVLDALTATTTDTYALTKNSVAVFPQTPANCIVSLNGVIQAPYDSYTISGSNIVFASALTASDSIDFITVLGDVLNVGTVSDGTIGLAKLSATGTKDATTFLRGDNTFQTIGTNTPAFLASSTSNQTIANNTATLISYGTELFDTDNCYDNTAGNYSFTPNVAGKYYVFASIRMDTATDFDYLQIEILKNNTSPPIAFSNMRSEFYEHLKCFTIVEMNGTTDFLQGRVLHQLGSNLDTNTGGANYIIQFGGYKIIE